MDVRFEPTTNDPWSVDDAICEGISLLGYWQEVNQSPTQTKPYNTLPPFEQREPFVKASVRWATGERSTNRLPKLSLITLTYRDEMLWRIRVVQIQLRKPALLIEL